MIYLDNNATTRPAERVIEAMLPFLRTCYFNPSSPTAAFTGAEKPRRDAAAAMAKLLNAEGPDCFRFTSGATESNNWVFAAVECQWTSGRVLISAIEHASVAEPAVYLSHRGFTVVDIPVDRDGVVRLDALDEALQDNTVLISIIAANNETGVLQPIREIGRLVRSRRPDALFHTDATQAVGKIPIDLQGDWEEIDLVSFSAHKFHGPKGVGGLYLRPGLQLPPLLRGGGQENGMRSGTTNTAGLAGLAAAATEPSVGAVPPVAQLRDKFERELHSRFPSTLIHSLGAPRLPNTSCFSLPDVIGDEVAMALAAEGIIVGTGSACSSGALRPPKTLLSMGVEYDIARAAIRVSLDESTDTDQLMRLLNCLPASSSSGHPSVDE